MGRLSFLRVLARYAGPLESGNGRHKAGRQVIG